ncbi:DUF6670 family protein [Mycobacteroides saopaulense]|uniref:Uncharacterized protein n=1 Tax=Mycobacteroides saopaulense TaxID=1578165 RepID=A0ABX3C1P0_9MYCO|nr:DUF6670 family protein [Mycobacteroides saopaulense]OHT84863.1 hypothetical protein BKG68_13390 [Mycobacteroides saopaulense]OHU11015.1 hypothetical protein BKG73_06425 [Mycobacteroides saopaulense]
MTRQPISRAFARLVLDELRPLMDRRLEASRKPFTDKDILRPHATSGMWAATHYGVFIPDLPSPHRYLNTMTLIGTIGAELFDNDYLATPDARHTATVLSSTAAGVHHHYRAYDSLRDCNFADNGSVLRWGNDLQIEVDHPHVTVRGRYRQFSADVELTVTDQVSYFVKTPVYDHLSLLAEYTGVIVDAAGATAISGLGTFEYARFLSHQSLTRRSLPEALKLPVDFFTYQIIDLGDGTQILLTDVRARGVAACLLAHVRVLGKSTEVYTDVRLDVTEYRENPSIDEEGRAMRIPHRLTWSVRDDRGHLVLAIEGLVDSPLRYGHGRGYTGAYSYTGEYQGNPVGGSAYMEWVDTRR